MKNSRQVQPGHANRESNTIDAGVSSAIISRSPAHRAALSRKTIEETPTRALKFLHAVGNKPEIARALKSVGYGLADHEDGWRLLRLVAGSYPGVTEDVAPSPGAQAVASLDAWIGVGFRRAQAALTHLHPAQAAFVFEHLHIVRGVEAVLAISAFLARLDELKNSPARKSMRATDHAALETLSKRGIGATERAHLAALLQVAQTLDHTNVASLPSTRPRDDTIIELHAWVRDWSEMARTVIVSRVDLVRLGIGKRRARTASTSPPPPAATPATSAAAPIPSVAAPAVAAPETATNGAPSPA